MKYLRTYENINLPQVGDYVKIDSNQFDYSIGIFSELRKFFVDEIGVIINIDDRETVLMVGYHYEVKFDNMLPKSYDSEITNIMAFKMAEMLEFDRSKEGLKIKLDIKKYNI